MKSASILFFILLVLSLLPLAAEAGLSDLSIESGPRQGQSLMSVVSEKVPARAVREAFAFFDKYQGQSRSALMYSIGPIAPKLQGYQCDNTGVDCKTKTVIQQLFQNKQFIVIFDLNETSMKPRLHIVNLGTGEVKSLFAAHGKQSSCPKDPTRACKFISDRDSEASPLGFFLTGEVFFGEVGWTVEMSGLQGSALGATRNDVPTTIVMHGAAYASPEFRRTRGFMGRSYGCPALSYDDIRMWKDRLSKGALFYFFHNSLPTTAAPASSILSPLKAG